MDKILGLEYGADDYITKPFNILEVKARIKAIMRRTARGNEGRDTARVVEKGGMRLVCDSRRVYIDDKEINLTAKEFEVLVFFIQHKDVAISRDRLLAAVWGFEYEGETRTIDIHIQQLRKKLNLKDKLVTIPKLGYRLESAKEQ